MTSVQMVGVASPTPSRVQRRLLRPATLIASLLAAVVLTLIAQHVIDSGYLRRDVEALRGGEAWRTGGWLAQVVLRAVSLFPGNIQQTVLSLMAAVVYGLSFGVLYDRLRASGWWRIGSVLILLALALHAGELYTISASSRAIPLYFAFAALIPAIRSLEDVGDVQAAIGLGLLLPLLLLASPLTTPLILPFAIGAALADRDGRRDPRAFLAMLLVAVLPTIIVAIGIVGFIAQGGMDIGDVLVPYVGAYSHAGFDPDLLAGGLVALVAFAPVALVPLFYCVWPSLPERRHLFSALAVVVLPLYLVVARATLVQQLPAMVPPLALIAAFVSWLVVVRLPFSLRLLSVVLMVLSVVASWTLIGFWDDPAWKAALFNFVPQAIGSLQLRLGN